MTAPLRLSWPDKILSPNARPHWAKKAVATKAARAEAWGVALEAKWQAPEDGPIKLHFAFCPPDRRRRDIDNLIAATKAARDGIADALKVDDSRFELSFSWSDKTKGGAVMVGLHEKRGKRRSCISCGAEFNSAGPQHRMCPSCRRGDTEFLGA